MGNNKYRLGYGLLGLSVEEFENMRIADFLNKVNGTLQWEAMKHKTYTDDILLWFSHFFACNMLASGNFKKGTTPQKIRQRYLYMTEDEEEEASKRKNGYTIGDKEKIEKEKEALKRQFNVE